jgi:hypothetical protein
VFAGGILAGVLATLLAVGLFSPSRESSDSIEPIEPPVCYSCLWDGYDAKLRDDVVDFYRQYHTTDPIVGADVRYILWRATDSPDCGARTSYQQAAREEDGYRRYLAASALGFSGPECGRSGLRELAAASQTARNLEFRAEANILGALASGSFAPRFQPTLIVAGVDPPPGARTMILGESAIEVTAGTKIGTQVDRVVRDWISFQMKWDLTDKPVAVEAVLDYHEGAVVRRILEGVAAEVYPLAGAVAARRGEQWFAPDNTGEFRFEILEDKLQYPTSHAWLEAGWIQDTHGLSVLVPQAIERRMKIVVACGDSEGKMYAAWHLAQHGLDVVFPGDFYEDMLLGYRAPGTLIGTAPIRVEGDRVVIGKQPLRISLAEPIVVEDTVAKFPVQYYAAPARYFRRLRESIPLRLELVSVDAPDQIERVLRRAAELNASVVGVRIATKPEFEALTDWLRKSARNRAVLFHSGLYPYAQPLFEEFPDQVSFGDLRPRFE